MSKYASAVRWLKPHPASDSTRSISCVNPKISLASHNVLRVSESQAVSDWQDLHLLLSSHIKSLHTYITLA